PRIPTKTPSTGRRWTSWRRAPRSGCGGWVGRGGAGRSRGVWRVERGRGRRMDRQAGRVSIRLCYVDGVESVREEALARPVANDFAAREVVQRLFEKARGRRIQIRHLEVTIADLRE